MTTPDTKTTEDKYNGQQHHPAGRNHPEDSAFTGIHDPGRTEKSL